MSAILTKNEESIENSEQKTRTCLEFIEHCTGVNIFIELK